MNLYILAYQFWHTVESTTSDGFPDQRSDWKEKKQHFESESDEDAQRQALEFITKEIQFGQKIRLPGLTRVVDLPKIVSLRTEQTDCPRQYTKVEAVFFFQKNFKRTQFKY